MIDIIQKRDRRNKPVQNGWCRTGLTLAALLLTSGVTHSAESQLDRGKYLVTIAGCTDCHTPGHFLGKPDMASFLGGSDVAFEIPGLGAFAGPNLTPDNETGLGKWSVAQIITALQTGKRPDGRTLAPSMPWRAYATMTQTDLNAMVVYLKSLPPVSRKVPGPFAPGDTVPAFMMRLTPPGQTAATGK